jgi:hypothetical protein
MTLRAVLCERRYGLPGDSNLRAAHRGWRSGREYKRRLSSAKSASNLMGGRAILTTEANAPKRTTLATS